MDELFSEAEVTAESPRLQWMKRHGIKTRDRGAEIRHDRRWVAWSDPHKQEAVKTCGAYHAPEAETEEDALLELATLLDIRLWNETEV